jgi:hypothetical protein
MPVTIALTASSHEIDTTFWPRSTLVVVSKRGPRCGCAERGERDPQGPTCTSHTLRLILRSSRKEKDVSKPKKSVPNAPIILSDYTMSGEAQGCHERNEPPPYTRQCCAQGGHEELDRSQYGSQISPQLPLPHQNGSGSQCPLKPTLHARPPPQRAARPRLAPPQPQPRSVTAPTADSDHEHMPPGSATQWRSRHACFTSEREAASSSIVARQQNICIRRAGSG